VAELVHVERVGRSFRLEIDGELFEFVDQPFPDGAADA